MERIIKLLEEKDCVPKRFRQISAREVRQMRLNGTLSVETVNKHANRIENNPRQTEGGRGRKGEKGGGDNINMRAYKFLAAEPDSIRINDIPDLLSEYKGLVVRLEEERGDELMMPAQLRNCAGSIYHPYKKRPISNNITFAHCIFVHHRKPWSYSSMRRNKWQWSKNGWKWRERGPFLKSEWTNMNKYNMDNVVSLT